MANETPGPFDRILKPSESEDGAPDPQPDRAAVYVGGTIIGLALLLLVLILPPISILSGGDGDGATSSEPGTADTYTSNVRSGMPKLPAGLAAASAMFDLAAPADRRGASGVTVPLKEKQTDVRNLALYTYAEARWQRLSDVTLVAGGAAARGEVSSLPGNVAVLKSTRATLQVAGVAPGGAVIDTQAAAVLTVLHPLAFIPGDGGEIGGTPPAVPPAGYKVVPGVVAPSPDVVDNILRSSDLRSRHAAAITQAVKDGNYAGISIDYRAVNPTLKEQLTSFVEALSAALHDDGRTLTLTLPMPARQGADIDTGAYDWEKLGAAADTIEIAGEEDQELYFQNTEAALQYAVEKVDRAKLLITISALSIERGGDGLRAMPLAEALTLAGTLGLQAQDEIVAGSQVQLTAQNLAQSEGASGMLWDETARSVAFSYPGLGGKRTVWIANEFSASFRLELAQRYEIAGVVVTSVAVEDGGADVWASIRELSDTGMLALALPNGERFAPSWSAASGTLSAQNGESVTWTAPQEPGTYEITLVVSDGVVRIGQLFRSMSSRRPPRRGQSDVRVIAGSARGRMLIAPPRPRVSGQPGLRPTSDLVRGVIFDMLDAFGVDYARVLDLYAGTGALGIEALSRGEGTADFIEMNQDAVAAIQANLQATGMAGRGRVYRMSALDSANSGLSGPYTLVLADPPYYDEDAFAAVRSLAASALADEATVIAVEHQRRVTPPEMLGPLPLYRTRRHGDSVVTIFAQEEDS